MVTFATQSPQVQKVGIGDQQIVQEGTTSFAGVLGAVGQAAGLAIETGADVFAKRKAADIVRDSTDALEESRLQIEQTGDVVPEPTAIESEEVEAQREKKVAAEEAAKEPVVMGVANTAQKLAAKEANGEIDRSTARLLLTSAVTKAIDEQPFLTDQIRAAASNLLGFNIRAEGTRQFFSSFRTQQEIAASNKPSKRQQRILDIAAANGGNMQFATEQVNGADNRDRKRQEIEDNIAIGNGVSELAFNEINALDSEDLHTGAFTDMVQFHAAGNDVTPSAWNQIVDVQKTRNWAAVIQMFNKSGTPPDTATLIRMKSRFDQKYADFAKSVEGLDATMLNQEGLERLSSMNQIWAAETLPVVKKLTDGFGDRTGAAIMDTVRSALGSPAKLNALITSAPHLKPLIEQLIANPKLNAPKMVNSMHKLTDPAAELTAEDSLAVDLLGSLTVKNGTPEEQENIAASFYDKKLVNKGTSLMVNAGVANATPAGKRRLKQEYDTIQATGHTSLANNIRKANTTTLLYRNAHVELTPSGNRLMLVQPRRLHIGRPFAQALHPAWKDITNMNTMLIASDAGWGNVLGVRDSAVRAQQFLDDINAALVEEVQTDVAEAVVQEVADTVVITDTKTATVKSLTSRKSRLEARRARARGN